MTLSEITSRLDNIKRYSGNLTARCPAHDDNRNSLSLTETHDKVMIFCHAGCSVNEVCAAIGIELKDLFTDDQHPPPRGDGLGEIVATYDYTDEFGDRQFQPVRFEPKAFRQRHWKNGEWVWGLNGNRRVVYRLPDILEAEEVFIVEGEKDVETLRAFNYPATCNPMGAGKWRPEY